MGDSERSGRPGNADSLGNPDSPGKNGERAYAVETRVEKVSGRWVVDLVVVMSDGVVHRRINDYSTQRQAQIAADWIQRGADRTDDPWSALADGAAD